jgi:hypothetical protein
MSFLRILEG